MATGAGASGAGVEKRSVVSAGSRRTGGVRSGVAKSSIMTDAQDAMSTLIGNVLPLPSIRVLQKRLAVIAAACDLPAGVQTVCQALHAGCALQLAANAAVDAVLAERCAPLIELRQREGDAFLVRVEGAYSRQVAAVTLGCENIAIMMAEIAHAVESHKAAQEDADEFVSEELRGALDVFEGQTEQLEAEFRQATTAVAHAPDLAALESRTTAALAVLDRMQQVYRSYHTTTCKWAALHPVKVDSVIRVQRAALCRIFGLSTDPAAVERIDGAPIPGEDATGGGRRPLVVWTMEGPQSKVRAKPPTPAPAPTPVPAPAPSPPASTPPSGARSGSPSAKASRPGSPAASGKSGAVSGAGKAAGPTALPLPTLTLPGGPPADAAIPAAGTVTSTGDDEAASDPPDSSRPRPGFALRRIFEVAAQMHAAPTAGGVEDDASDDDTGAGGGDGSGDVGDGEGGDHGAGDAADDGDTLESGERRRGGKVDDDLFRPRVTPDPPLEVERLDLPLGLPVPAPSSSALQSTLRSVAGAGTTAQVSLESASSAQPRLVYTATAPTSLLAAFLADGERTLAAASRRARKQGLVAALQRLRRERRAALVRAEEARTMAAAKAVAIVPGKKLKKGSKEEAEAKAAEDAAAAATTAAAAVVALEAEARAAASALSELELEAASPQAAAHAHALASVGGDATLVAAFRAGTYGADGLTPLDPSGAPAIAPIQLPLDGLTATLTALRGSLLTAFHQYVAERRTVAAALAASRTTAFTVELEERLRRHWPRAGNLEVSVRAPRAEQLVEHTERLDRLVRRLRDKSAVQAAGFRARFDAFARMVAERMGDVAAVTTALTGDGAAATISMTGVQSLAAKARALKAGYEADSKRFVEEWRRDTADQAARIVMEGEEFVGRCATWEAGGSYDDAEVAAARAAVAGVCDAIKATANEQDSAIERTDADAHVMHDHLAALSTLIVSTQEAVALRDGIGSTYGEPRRVAQEKLRTAANDSEAAAAYLQGRVEELRMLLRESAGAVPATPLPAMVSPSEETVAVVRASYGMHDTAMTAPPAAALTTTAPAAVPSGSGAAPSGAGAAVAGGGRKGSTGASTAAAAAAATASAGTGKAASGVGSTGGKPAAGGSAAAGPSPAPSAVPPPSTAAAASAAAAAQAALEADMARGKRAGPVPLAVRLRRCVQELRDAMFARAVHLGAFKVRADMHGPLRTFNLPFLSMLDAAPAATQWRPSPPAFTGDGSVVPALSAPAPAPAPADGHVPAGGGADASLSAATPSAWVEVCPLLGDTDPTASAPHTLKGPSPSSVATAARDRPAYLSLVHAALAECRSGTMALFARHGTPLASEADLPKSLLDFVSKEAVKADDNRESALRAFREQVAAVQAMLADVPALLIGDVVARSEARAAASLASNQRAVGNTLASLEAARLRHAGQLKLRLGDTNAAAELDALLAAERDRGVAVLRTLAAGATQESERFLAAIARCHADVAHATRMFLLTAEECVRAEDLVPLPGDELAVPVKLSHRRLHKALRKSRVDGAAVVAAAAAGDVDDVEVDDAGNLVVSNRPAPASSSSAATPRGGAGLPVGVAAAPPAKGTSPAAASGAGGKGTVASPAATPTGKGAGPGTSGSAGGAKGAHPPGGKPSTTAAGADGSGDGALGSTATGSSSPSTAAASQRALRDAFQQRAWSPLPLLPIGDGAPSLAPDAVPPSSGAVADARKHASQCMTLLEAGSLPPATGAGAGAVASSYCDWSRHAVAQRDEQYAAFLARATSASATFLAHLTAAEREASTWQALWARNVSAVCNRAVAVPPVSLAPPPAPSAQATSAPSPAAAVGGAGGAGKAGASAKKAAAK